MSKIIIGAVFLCSIFLFTSCKNSATTNPNKVLLEFIDALEKKDINTARNLATSDSKTVLDEVEKSFKSQKPTADSLFFDKSKMEFSDAKIEDNIALIPVKIKDINQSINFILKKEDGSWKVAFNENFIVQLGMYEMQEKGINSLDSLNTTEISNLKDINVDSFAEAMKKDLKAADSFLNSLKK